MTNYNGYSEYNIIVKSNNAYVFINIDRYKKKRQ